MKKLWLVSSIVLVALLMIVCINWLFTPFSDSTTSGDDLKVQEADINPIDLKNINELFIGAEPPRLIYADKDKVIFQSSGVYVYDLNNQGLDKSFDIDSKLDRVGCFVTKDGQEIIFAGINKFNKQETRYSFSFSKKIVREIDESEYKEYTKNRFECTLLDYKDKLYEKSSGSIVNLSNNEYIYLTFSDWKVSTIRIVYIKNDKEIVYGVFDKV